MNDEPDLQLMVHDDTDIGARLKELGTVPVGLTHTWIAGGHLYRLLRHVDTFKGFGFWHRALEWLATVHPEQRIQEIQYWGHGSPGRVWMNGKALTIDAFDGAYRPMLEAVRDRLTDDALIWFRTCATFGADGGRAFARRAADFFGCRVAAHTHNIGLFHGGLHSLAPGAEPDWPADEGVAEGTAAEPKKMKMSRCRTVNRITCLTADVPRGW